MTSEIENPFKDIANKGNLTPQLAEGAFGISSTYANAVQFMITGGTGRITFLEKTPLGAFIPAAVSLEFSTIAELTKVLADFSKHQEQMTAIIAKHLSKEANGQAPDSPQAGVGK